MLLPWISLALGSSTWQSYKTAWDSFWSFSDYRPDIIPASELSLLTFALFLYTEKNLRASSVKNYLSGLRFWHILSHSSTSAFDSPSLKLVLTGFTNADLVDPSPPFSRRVMTFAALQLLGDSLQQDSSLSAEDKVVLWVLSLIAWWGSCRLGSLIPTAGNAYDQFRSVKWEDFKYVDNDHLTLHLRIPKVCSVKGGSIIEIFSYQDKRFCPIFQLRKLVSTRGLSSLSSSADVFVFSSGSPIHMGYLNRKLKQWMSPLTTDNKSSFTCHSFRQCKCSYFNFFSL